MYDAGNNAFVPINPELAAKFANPDAVLTATEAIQRTWTRFSEGETVTVKGIEFRVDEISERRLVLKPIDKKAFAEKQSA